MFKKLVCLSLLVACVGWAGAFRYTIDDAVGNWNDPNVWDGSTVPTSSQNVILGNFAEITVSDGEPSHAHVKTLYIGQKHPTGNPYSEPGTLYVSAGGHLRTEGELWVGNAYNGYLNVSGGTVSVQEGFFGSHSGDGITVMTGGSVNCASAYIGLMTSTGQLILEGGSFKAWNFFYVNHPSYPNANGYVNIAGGALIVKGTITNATSMGNVVAYGGYGTFQYDTLSDPGYTIITATPPQEPAQPEVDLYAQGLGFADADPIVSTSVFLWYTSTAGQLNGPWLPLEGRPNWHGTPAFWETHIKQMMRANIDVMYMHMWADPDGLGDPQSHERFLGGYESLRRQGYDVPKVAPFLDLLGPGVSYNLGTEAGKDAFVQQYIDWFNIYFDINTDANAASYLARVDGKIMLTTWHLFNSTNYHQLTRHDVESRLQAAFPGLFDNGVYMVTTQFGQLSSWADEEVPMFQVNDYLVTRTFNGRTTAQVKGGYWDENVRPPEAAPWLARAGGVPYANAWNTVNNTPAISRVYVESFNEYDEGTGIYATDVVNSPYTIEGRDYTPGSTTDTFSSTDDPWEYIKTTHLGASVFNTVADLGSTVLWHNFPSKMLAGSTRWVTVLVRNEGNLLWNNANGISFKETTSGTALGANPEWFVDAVAANEVPWYGGIFRGGVAIFLLRIQAPATLDTYNASWRMAEDGTTFGPTLNVSVEVTTELDPGLIAYYPLNVSSADESGNGFNGGSTTVPAGTNNFTGSAFYCGMNDVNGYINTPGGIPAMTDRSFSWAVWVRPDSSDPRTSGLIYRHELGTESHNVSGHKTLFLTTDRVGFQTWDVTAQNYNNVQVTHNVWDDQWHHLAVTYDDTDDTVTLYINGVAVTSKVIDLGAQNEGFEDWGFWFGLYPGGWFKGELSDVRIYNYTLDAPEVEYLWGRARLIVNYQLLNSPWNYAPCSPSRYYGGTSNDAHFTGSSFYAGKDGNHSYAYTGGNIPVLTNESFSWTLWLKPDSTDADKQGTVIARRQTSPTAAARKTLVLQEGNVPGHAWLALTGTGGSTIFAPHNAVAFDEWNHIAVTYNTADHRVTIYVNGSPVTWATRDMTGTAEDLANSSYWFGLGGSQNWLKGEFSDVRLYQGALSGAEVRQLADADAELVVHYSLNDPVGTTSPVDSSGNNHSGIMWPFGNEPTHHWTGNSFYANRDGHATSFFLTPAGISRLQTNDSFSWAIWVKPDPADGYNGTLIHRGNYDQWTDGAKQLAVRPGNVVEFMLYGLPSVQATVEGLWDGNWTHLAVTYDSISHDVRLYVNGSQAATGMRNLSVRPEGAHWQCIFGYSQGAGWYRGELRDARLYSGTLTPEQISGFVMTSDITGDGGVDLADFAIMSRFWLEDAFVAGSQTPIENGSFEGYANTAALQVKWTQTYDSGNGTSTVSLLTDPADAYAGSKAMRWHYDTAVSGDPKYTTILYTFDTNVDWTDEEAIIVRIKRHAGNSEASELFLRIFDTEVSSGGLIAEASLTQAQGSTFANPGQWSQWAVNLSELNYFYGNKTWLDYVKAIQLGVRDTGLSSGGSGTLDIDQITVGTPDTCDPSAEAMIADLDGNCVVDLADLVILVEEWLMGK